MNAIVRDPAFSAEIEASFLPPKERAQRIGGAVLAFIVGKASQEGKSELPATKEMADHLKEFSDKGWDSSADVLVSVNQAVRSYAEGIDGAGGEKTLAQGPFGAVSSQAAQEVAVTIGSLARFRAREEMIEFLDASLERARKGESSLSGVRIVEDGVGKTTEAYLPLALSPAASVEIAEYVKNDRMLDKKEIGAKFPVVLREAMKSEVARFVVSHPGVIGGPGTNKVGFDAIAANGVYLEWHALKRLANNTRDAGAIWKGLRSAMNENVEVRRRLAREKQGRGQGM